MRIVAIIIAMLTATATAHTAEINAFISTAIKTATDELLPPFARANGHTIRASYAPSGALIPRFDRGEPVDVFLTDSAAIDELIKRSKVVAPRTDLARTGIGIAVRKGAPKPDVEIDALITTAMKAAVDELAPPFERANGQVLRITYGPSGGLARRLNARRPISSSWTARRSTS